MKKVGLKALFFTLILSMVFAGSAFAATARDHVSLAPNGKGDVLIFPAYFTTEGWETKLVVTNTSPTQSVVAKVIIRSKEDSQELRDFLIYLSPMDVWTGTLYTGDLNGLPWPYIKSTDDSVLANGGQSFASKDAPFDYWLEDACPGDTNDFGYVTVIMGASYNLPLTNGKVAKSAIKAAHDAYTAPLAPINSLAGKAEFTNTQSSNLKTLSYTLNATTLKNYLYDITGTKLSVNNPTALGENANNTKGEIEAALSKNDIVVPYYARDVGSTLMIANFPTKLASIGQTGNVCRVRASWSGQFNYFPTPTYQLFSYDLEENKETTTDWISPITTTVNNFPSELNFLSVVANVAPFSEGWIHITGTYNSTGILNANNNTFSYTGIPVIAASMRFDNNGQGGFLYNAHSLGTIDLDNDGLFNNTDEERNYHYWAQ